MKTLFTIIFILISFLQATELNLVPLFYSSYQPIGGTWSTEENNIFLGGWGFNSEFKSTNLNITEHYLLELGGALGAHAGPNSLVAGFQVVD